MRRMADRLYRLVLLLLLDVHGVLAKTRTEFAEFQLFTAGLATKGVVVITGLFADEEDDFFLFLLGHDLIA